MPRVHPLVSTFASGEIEPRLYGRSDLTRYASAARRVENFIVLAQGGITRRPGTIFIGEAASFEDVVLIPFQYSTTQHYILELTGGRMRFYTLRGRIEDPPGTPAEVVTPWQQGELHAVRWTQTADEMYLVHPAYQPQVLRRTSLSSFTLSPFAFQDGPYLPANPTETELTPDVTTGTATVTASANVFAASDVGRFITFLHGTDRGHGVIAAFTSATEVDVTVLSPLGAATGTKNWALGAFSDELGWPSVVTFHEDRLLFANTETRPQTAWLSRTAQYDRFTPGAEPDRALQFTLADDQVNAIRWALSGASLFLGTSAGPFVVRASIQGEALSPSNITARRVSRAGAADDLVAPIQANAVYVDRNRRRLHDITFDVNVDDFAAPELTPLVSHLARGLRSPVFQDDPWRCVWMIREGGLLGMTYLREQQVVAFHRHALGGTAEGDEVLSLASVSTDAGDEVWFAVRRTIEGQPYVYIECMARPYDTGGFGTPQIEDGAWYLDSALAYEGTPVSTVSGLGHLEGRVVEVLANDGAHPVRTVSGGSVTLERPSSKVVVGLGYTSRLETLPVDAGAADGTAQSRRKRIGRASVLFEKTLGGQAGVAYPARGSDVSDLFQHEQRVTYLTPILWRRAQNLMDVAVYPQNGWQDITLPAAWDDDVSVVVEQSQPLPMTIVGMVPTQTVND